MIFRRAFRISLAAVLVASLVAMPEVFLPPASAQATQDPAPQVQRREPNLLMGERAFRRFDTVTSHFSDGRYEEARAAVEAYLNIGLTDFERAMGEQIYGYILISLNRTDDAVPRFERALELDVLPNRAHFGLMRSLAQLYASREEWQRSINMMTEYLRFQPEPSAEDSIIMAQNYVQLERYRDALSWVRRAIDSSGDQQARESWYQLELAIHFELKDYNAALRTLRILVARWPDQLRYWEMMAGAHQQLNQESDALAALMAAYNGGLIREEAKILNLVRMSLYNELHYSGGQILQRAIDNGQVERNERNLRLLYQAWSAAHEYNRAGAVIDVLAPMTGDGNLLIQKARLMMEQNDWQGTIDAARAALELGNVTNQGGAWLLIGIAAMELGQLRDSRQAFQRAQDFDASTRRQAREWQRFVEDRIQLAELRGGR